MNKRLIVIIILAGILILGGMVWLYTSSTSATLPTGALGTPRTFNPFGIFGPQDTAPRAPTTSTNNEPTFGGFISRFRRIAVGPIAGAIFYEATNTGPWNIRFVERETGNIFESGTSTTATRRLTNTTIPRIQNALWSPVGDMVAVQYLRDDGETIETFLAKVPAQPAQEEGVPERPNEQVLEGVILPPNIFTLSWNPSGKGLFSIIPDKNGSIAFITNSITRSTKSAFSSPLHEWRAFFSNGRVLLSTKASRDVRGFSYTIAESGGEMKKVLGDHLALATLPNSTLSKILYSSLVNGQMMLSVLDVKTLSSTALGIATLAEKCVWAIDDVTVYCGVPIAISDTTPDAWYQGLLSFGDTLWKIDTTNNISEILVDTSAYVDSGIDIIAPTVDNTQSHILLIDKKTGALWILRLAE